MAQAGRGGGGAKGGQGGAGREGSGAGSTGGRDAAMGGRDNSKTGQRGAGSLSSKTGTLGAPDNKRSIAAPAGKERGFMESIGDMFGGPQAYANNPNAPGGKWNTRDFMVASYPDANWQAVVSSLFEAPTSPVGFATKMMSAAMDPTGPGMGMMGRMIGADYGQRGPDQPGGGLGRANQGGGGAIRPGYDLPPGYMQPQPPVPTVNPQPTLPSYGNLNMPGKYLGIAPGYGAGVPGYSYQGPMKR